MVQVPQQITSRGFGTTSRSDRRNAASAFKGAKRASTQKDGGARPAAGLKRPERVSAAPADKKVSQPGGKREPLWDAGQQPPKRTRQSTTSRSSVPALAGLIALEYDIEKPVRSRHTLREIISMLSEDGSDDAVAASALLSDMNALLEQVDFRRQHVVSARPRKLNQLVHGDAQ